MYALKIETSLDDEVVSTKEHGTYYSRVKDAQLAMVRESQVIFRSLTEAYNRGELSNLPTYTASQFCGTSNIGTERVIGIACGESTVLFCTSIYVAA